MGLVRSWCVEVLRLEGGGGGAGSQPTVTYSSDPAMFADRGSSAAGLTVAATAAGASVSSSSSSADSGVTKAEASNSSSPSSLMSWPRSRVTYARLLLGVVVLRESRVRNARRISGWEGSLEIAAKCYLSCLSRSVTSVGD